jgi:protein phosphatase
MTRDHSLLNEYTAAMPELTEEQRSELPKNVITRALGMQDQVTVDLQSDDVRPGDIYVLCSDGLSGMVEDDEMLGVVGSEVKVGLAVEENTDLHAACTRLIALANEHGGEDNVTAVVVKVVADERDQKELSFSDTLRDQPELDEAAAQLRATVEAAESADAATVEMADTPPAGIAADKSSGE